MQSGERDGSKLVFGPWMHFIQKIKGRRHHMSLFSDKRNREMQKIVSSSLKCWGQKTEGY
jgi:primosomal protein N'